MNLSILFNSECQIGVQKEQTNKTQDQGDLGSKSACANLFLKQFPFSWINMIILTSVILPTQIYPSLLQTKYCPRQSETLR